MFVFRKRRLAITVVIILAVCLSGCGINVQYTDSSSNPSPSVSAGDASADISPSADISAQPSNQPSPDVTQAPSASPSPTALPSDFVAYNGIVEHLFFHPVIAYPELAFDGDFKEKGLDDYMVTVSEYDKMLQSLYDNNYIIVNMNDVWSETTDTDGVTVMVKNTLILPEGKKPIILSYDDVNYYGYMLDNGLTYKLVVRDGEIWSYGLDPEGNPVYSQDLDAVTILDKFVKEHPDFSLNGAKGCLCLTGYEGILGYRTMTDINNMTPQDNTDRILEIAAVRPVITVLKNSGWYFGSHSWGHISLTKSSLTSVTNDSNRWLDEVGSLVGSTTLYFYPFGARPDGDDVTQTGSIFTYLQSMGFRVFASVGIESYSKIKSDIAAVICDRMHADGTTLRKYRENYLKFYDAKLVFDYEYRPDFGNTWV